MQNYYLRRLYMCVRLCMCISLDIPVYIYIYVCIHFFLYSPVTPRMYISNVNNFILNIFKNTLPFHQFSSFFFSFFLNCYFILKTMYMRSVHSVTFRVTLSYHQDKVKFYASVIYVRYLFYISLLFSECVFLSYSRYKLHVVCFLPSFDFKDFICSLC